MAGPMFPSDNFFSLVQFSSKVSSSDLKAMRDDVAAWSSSKDNFDFGSSSVASHSSGSKTSLGPHPSSSRVIGPSRGPKEDTRQVLALPDSCVSVTLSYM